MKISPIEIRKKEFEKAFRGYEKEEVDASLQSLSQEWEKVQDESRELQKKVELLEKEIDRMREVEATLFRTLKTAEDTSSNIIELMKSRLVVEKTLLNPVTVNGKELSLADYYIQINNLKEAWAKKPALANMNFPIHADRTKFSLEQDSVLQIISAGLTKNNLVIAQKDKKVSIISLTVKTENELFSKLFCEQLLKETSDFYIETKSKKSRLNVDILQHQADSIRAELNNAITGVAAATDNVYNLNPAFNVKSTPSKRKQVDVQANTAILTQLVAQLELSKVSLRKETPLVQLIDRPILPLEKEKLGRIKSFVLGGFLAGFLSVLYLVFGRLYKNLVA